MGVTTAMQIHGSSPAAASFRSYSILANTSSPGLNNNILDSQGLIAPKYWLSTTAVAAEEDNDSDSDNDKDSVRLFSSLDNLHPRTLALLQKQGIQDMTEIQAKTWDAVSTGNDVVGRSRTGSGMFHSLLWFALFVHCFIVVFVSTNSISMSKFQIHSFTHSPPLFFHSAVALDSR